MEEGGRVRWRSRELNSRSRWEELGEGGGRVNIGKEIDAEECLRRCRGISFGLGG
jgi:hypothetical protein